MVLIGLIIIAVVPKALGYPASARRQHRDDVGQGAWHCVVRLVYGVLHGLVLPGLAGGWDLGPAGRTHASAGPLS
jgi:hypothetical protein